MKKLLLLLTGILCTLGLWAENDGLYYVERIDGTVTRGLFDFHSAHINEMDLKAGDKVYMYYQNDNGYFEDSSKKYVGFDIADISLCTAENSIQTVAESDVTCYTATKGGYYLFEYTPGSETANTVTAKLTVHPVTHKVMTESTKTTRGNIDYFYCANCDKYRSYVDGELTVVSEDDVFYPLVVTLNDGENSLGDITAYANGTAKGQLNGEYIATGTGLYKFTSSSTDIYVMVSGGSSSSTGQGACIMNCIAGTTYYVSCMNNTSETISGVTLTIEETTLPALSVGDNTVPASVPDMYSGYSAKYTFTPTTKGDYVFQISDVASGAEFMIGTGMSLSPYDASSVLVTSNDNGKGVLYAEAGTTYYVLPLSSGDEDIEKAKLTITQKTVPTVAVYDSSEKSLTFYHDDEDHTAEGIVVYAVEDWTTPSWNVEAVSSNATEVEFDHSMANARPTSISAWFKDFTALKNVRGLSYLNLSDVSATSSMFEDMFNGCSLISSMYGLPDGLTAIGANAFKGCSALTSISLPSSVQTIGTDAFNSCDKLSRVTYYSIPSIAESAFVKSNGKAIDYSASLELEDDSYVDVDASNTHITSASSATYMRNMSNTWGTVVLPFDVTSNEEMAEFYGITGIDDGVLTISKYETLPAGTPALVKKLSEYGFQASAANVSVTTALNNVSGTVSMKGSYTDDTKVTDENAYYISNNKFYKNNQYFYIDAFRAYFTTSAAGAKNSVLTIGEEEVTAIEALTNDSAEVKIVAIYDASGAARSELGNGLNIVKLSNGKTQKIMVKK